MINKRKNKKLVAVAVICSVAVVIFTMLLGEILSKYTLSIVVTNSMYPTIPKNTYVIIDNRNIDSIEINDIVLYSNEHVINVVHRIIKVGIDDDGEEYYVTKGDNNENADDGVRYMNSISGKVVYIIDETTIIGKALKFICGNNSIITVATILCCVGIAIITVWKLINLAIQCIKRKIHRLFNRNNNK